MVRRKPITQKDIDEREKWPENKASRYGPEVYETLKILDSKLRSKLAVLARIPKEQEQLFIDDVTLVINSYRGKKRHSAQQSAASIAESIRQMIQLVKNYQSDVAKFPDFLVYELQPPLPDKDWFNRANDKLHKKNQLVKGHRPLKLTYDLLLHAWTLQRAGACSMYLALNWQAMRDWLAVALEASGEPPTKGHGRAAFLKQLMLPCAENGAVVVDGRPPALDAFKGDL
jgi:hypothetical protein